MPPTPQSVTAKITCTQHSARRHSPPMPSPVADACVELALASKTSSPTSKSTRGATANRSMWRGGVAWTRMRTGRGSELPGEQAAWRGGGVHASVAAEINRGSNWACGRVGSGAHRSRRPQGAPHGENLARTRHNLGGRTFCRGLRRCSHEVMR